MTKKRTVALLIIVSVTLSLGAGCSRYKPPPIDISKGEYYEEEEYQKLSKKDREIYCKAHAEELEDLQDRSEHSQQELADNKERIKNLTKELFDLRFQSASENLSNPARIGQIKKTIAKIRTIVAEREKGIRGATPR